MKRKYYLAFGGLLLAALALQAQEKTVVITTNVGTMEAKLYPDVPNHTRTFIERAAKGAYNGALFTRVIKDFMIQGGSPDSKNAPAGARVGFGDRSAEILPEFRDSYFHKKGALAAPRQGDEINPQKKSDMSQFFIVQGKVYRPGELDTMQIIKNAPIRKKAMNEYYQPVREELDSLRTSNTAEYNRRAIEINTKVDSVISATPGHLLFTPEQREAYTTIGGAPHLDGLYTIYGELTSGFDILDQIASQARDAYDRPKKDIRILSITIK
jgi:cyclophilin family peptidyl-prolyl cis-trans isomerase